MQVVEYLLNMAPDVSLRFTVQTFKSVDSVCISGKHVLACSCHDFSKRIIVTVLLMLMSFHPYTLFPDHLVQCQSLCIVFVLHKGIDHCVRQSFVMLRCKLFQVVSHLMRDNWENSLNIADISGPV